MSPSEMERWRDRPEGEDAEARAGALFRSVEVPEPPPALDLRVRAITSGRVQGSSRRRARTLILVLAATGVAGIAGAASRGWVPSFEIFMPSAPAPTKPSTKRASATPPTHVEVSETSSVVEVRALDRRIGAALREPARPVDRVARSDEVSTPPVARREAGKTKVTPIAGASETTRTADVERPVFEAPEPGAGEGDEVRDDGSPDGPRSALRDESRLLASAVRALRAGDPEETLRLVARHRQVHPKGELARDVHIVEVQALAQLGHTGAALDVLDTIELAAVKRELPLVVLRAELRARAGRCADARADVERARGSADLDALLFSRTERVLETCRR